jgi:osmotically-inducible protein OsmY
MKIGTRLLVAVGIAALMAGCNSQQEASVENSVNNAAGEVANSAQQVGKEIANKAQPMVKEAARAMDNSEVTLRVKAAFGASAQLDASGIEVSTTDKVTTLAGTVPDAAQHKLALTIAKSTVGKDIKLVDKLKVKPAATKSGG